MVKLIIMLQCYISDYDVDGNGEGAVREGFVVKCGLRMMEVVEHNACPPPPLLTDDSTRGWRGATNRGFAGDDDDGGRNANDEVMV